MKNINGARVGLAVFISLALLLLYVFTFNASIFPTVPESIMPWLGQISPVEYDPPQSFQVLGWIPYWDQSAAIASYEDNPEAFDFLGVYWYAVNQDGVVRPYPYANIDRTFVDIAQQRGTKVLALIANLPPEDEGGNWDPDRLDQVLSSAQARTAHVADIMRLVETENFDGINIDYENMRPDQRQDFTSFVQELSQALHAQGKILGVSLMPKVGEGNPQFSNGSEAQDWQRLAQYADHLYLMTYEQHWEDSAPGSVAALPWMEAIMAYARRLIPPDKLFGGIPMYGYNWPEDGSAATGLTYAQVQNLISTHSPEVQWDDTAKSWFFTYQAGGQNHTVWFEDAQSTADKYRMFQEYGVGNVGVWRIGGEDKRLWSTLMPHLSASPDNG